MHNRYNIILKFLIVYFCTFIIIVLQPGARVIRCVLTQVKCVTSPPTVRMGLMKLRADLVTLNLEISVDGKTLVLVNSTGLSTLTRVLQAVRYMYNMCTLLISFKTTKKS